MGGDDGRFVGRGHGQVLGVGEPADVVAEPGAGPEGLLGHRGPPGVHRDGQVVPVDQALDGGQEPFDLFALGHLGTGTGLDGADIQDVGPLGHDLVGPGQKASQSHVAPLSKNESGVRLRIPMTSARWAMS